MNWKKESAVASIAGRIVTINYEVTARIPSRVPRIYLDEQTG
jgi:alanine racemase